MRQKEEGFSVYLMGANEDRIKNIRRKEIIEKQMKSRQNNNYSNNNKSRSIANRKKWGDYKDNKSSSNRINFNNLNNVNNNDLLVIANESRSKSNKKKEIKKSAGGSHIDYKAISKLILNNTNSISNNNQHSNTNFNVNNNSGFKNIFSKDSITNLEEMLNDINTVNKNVSNLNKLNINSESPINKRRRNWNEPKYNIVFPDLSTSIEKGLSGGLMSSKNKKRSNTNYSNNLNSNNNLNSSFNKITENEIDGFSSLLGADYNNLNSSITGVSKEKGLYLSKKKFYGNYHRNQIDNFYEYQHKRNNTNVNEDLSSHSQNSNNNNNNPSAINVNNNNLIYKTKENFKSSGSSMLLSNLNQSSNNALSYNKQTYSSNSNNNVNSNPDVVSTALKVNSKKVNSNSKNNFEIMNSALITNRYWEGMGTSVNKKKPFQLNTSNELGKNFHNANNNNNISETENNSNNYVNAINNFNNNKAKNDVMLVLENLNNSDILNISNSGINNNNNNSHLFKKQNTNIIYNEADFNHEKNSLLKSNKLSFGKKYNNISVNMHANNHTSNFNSKKFLSMNSNNNNNSNGNYTKKLEELNFSNVKNKFGSNTNVNMNINSNNANNISSANNNVNIERPFSSIVNLSKLKSEKLKISDLGSVSGISPKNFNIPSIQFIYKSPQNVNLKSAQRPLSHIQKSKSILQGKNSSNNINFNNVNTSNINSNLFANPIESSQNPYNLKASNTNNTMERFSSRERQTKFINTNFQNSINNTLFEETNQFSAKDISNTQFNFSRKKNIYPLLSNAQKQIGNNNIINNTHGNISNQNILSNIIYSRNSSPNSNNQTNFKGSSDANGAESNILLSTSNNIKEIINSNIGNIKDNFENLKSKNKNISLKDKSHSLNNNNHNSNQNNINNLNINSNTNKKTDLLNQLDKLDEKKMKKVFKYIERLSNHPFDNSEISILESRNFIDNQSKNIGKFIIFINIK